MPPIVIADAVQVTINGDAGDGPYANVFAFNNGAGTLLPEELAQAVLDGYVENMLPQLCNTVSVNDAYFIDLSSSSGLTGTVNYTGGDPTTGGVNADACPPQVAALVAHETTGGRGTRGGRTFLPGVREDEVDAAGIITPTTRGTLGAGFDGFMTGVESGSGAVFSIIHRGVSGAGALTPVTASTVQASVATLRRRLNR